MSNNRIKSRKIAFVFRSGEGRGKFTPLAHPVRAEQDRLEGTFANLLHIEKCERELRIADYQKLSKYGPPFDALFFDIAEIARISAFERQSVEYSPLNSNLITLKTA